MKYFSDPKDWGDIPKRPDWLLAAAAFSIGAAGVAVRYWAYLQTLVQEPFWYDEAYTWLIAHLPMADLVAATAADVHPPLWYLLARHFNPWPVEAARLLPFLFSVIGLWLFYQVLKEFPLPVPARLGALALMAFSPVQIFYSVELRMYSLLQALVLLQLFAVLRRRYWLFGLATVLALYTHNYAILYSAVIGLIALAREMHKPTHVPPAGSPLADFGGHHYTKADEAKIRDLVLWSIIAVALYLPWVSVLVKQMQFVGSGMHWVQPLTFGQAANALYAICVAMQLPGVLGILAYAFFAGGLVLAVIPAARARQFTLLAWALGPFALAIIGSLFTPMMLFRGLIASTGGMFALFAFALSRGGSWKWVGAALVSIVMAVSLGYYVAQVETGQSKNVTYNARHQLGPGVIVHLDDTTLVSWSAYPQADTQHVLLDAGCLEPIAGLGPQVRAAMGLRSALVADLPTSYTLVANLSGFSNACQEYWFHQLTDGHTPLRYVATPYQIFGIWSIEESYGFRN